MPGRTFRRFLRHLPVVIALLGLLLVAQSSTGTVEVQWFGFSAAAAVAILGTIFVQGLNIQDRWKLGLYVLTGIALSIAVEFSPGTNIEATRNITEAIVLGVMVGAAAYGIALGTGPGSNGKPVRR